ncbi:MAG: hypothetical protein ACK40S_03000, partial [Burkholderiaceae bacterium]
RPPKDPNAFHRDPNHVKPIKLDIPPHSRICNATATGPYDGAELRKYADRPGAMDAYSIPSKGN